VTVKIAHVVTTFYDTNATGWVMALASDQKNRGCQVDLVVGRNASLDLLAEKQAQGFGVVQVPSLRKYVRPFQEIQALIDLYRVFRVRQYDVVHTHLAKAGVIGRLAARLAGGPRVVHSVYGATFAPTQIWPRRIFFRDLERLAGKATDCFIFVGRELQEAYCRAGVCSADQGQVVYYGKDLSPFLAVASLSREERRSHRRALGLGDQDIVMGNVSRVVPWKGHDLALEVFARLKKTFPTLKLIIVGDAKTPSEQGYKERLLNQVRRRGWEEDIRFTGWVRDPARYFAAFDLYLLTSMPFEGVPGAVIEATMAGVPVVGFDCYGVREIPGVRATLVPPKDTHALTLVLRDQLHRLAAVESGGYGSSRAVQEQMRQQFDLDSMVRKTWDIYHQFIGEHNYDGTPA